MRRMRPLLRHSAEACDRKRILRSEVDEIRLEGVPDEPGRLVDIELLHEVGAVRVDGARAEEELFADFLARKPLSDELENLDLALGELRPCFGDRLLIPHPLDEAVDEEVR